MAKARAIALIALSVGPGALRFQCFVDGAGGSSPPFETLAGRDGSADAPGYEAIKDYQRAKAGMRYVEAVADGLNLEMDIYDILHSSTSDVQSIQVVDTFFGRTLVTDGKTQSSGHDEFVYHESLVHPAMFWSAQLAQLASAGEGAAAPRTVFIGGGGELATAREVLKHRTVERVVMVDLDDEVIEVSRKHLPEWGGDAVLNHPKVEYVVGDVRKYLADTREKFDVIIIDVSDPIEAGPAVALYTKEFYETASRRLTQNGVLVTQSGSASFVPFPQVDEESSCFAPIRNTLATVFDHAVPFSCPVASFGEDWGFVMAFNGDEADARSLRLVDETIDVMIEDRIAAVPKVPDHAYRSIGVKRILTGYERGANALKHYDGESHRGLFILSKPLRNVMKNDSRIMTDDSPLFMF
mmetsp:Transcript_26059/g.59582  ORF Transcript_26059/g.59582 Transcript_26059/m.59582 type:complete len:411 (-) Transcript_26059:154-1386(-)